QPREARAAAAAEAQGRAARLAAAASPTGLDDNTLDDAAPEPPAPAAPPTESEAAVAADREADAEAGVPETEAAETVGSAEGAESQE
ncbi:MAG: hypothetical protein ACYCZV_17310, partial [Acidimicrobiales bacterium]